MTSRVPTPPSRRRFDRVGGSVLAVIGVVVAIVAIVALQHPNGRQAKPVSLKTSTSTVTATATKTTTNTPPPPSHPSTPISTPSGTPGSSTSSGHPIPLLVLNTTSINGLGDTATQQFEASGWTVTNTENYSNDILSTCAYYDPSDPANQQQAEQLQQEFPAIKRVKERFPDLPAGPIVVALTSDYSG
jgi:LytR cell envelope-related transcriptional attenuator